MSAHSIASDESQYLCEQLINQLSALIPDIQIKQTKRWCALYENGKNRFAYISHRRSMSRIEIWCLGDLNSLLPYSNIQVIPRTVIKTGWETRFPARFYIDSSSEIPSACDLLFNVSYRAT